MKVKCPVAGCDYTVRGADDGFKHWQKYDEFHKTLHWNWLKYVCTSLSMHVTYWKGIIYLWMLKCGIYLCSSGRYFMSFCICENCSGVYSTPFWMIFPSFIVILSPSAFPFLLLLCLFPLLLVPPLVCKLELEIVSVIRLHKVGIEEVDPVLVQLSVKIIKLLEVLIAFRM